jgi:hypothetical protein
MGLWRRAADAQHYCDTRLCCANADAQTTDSGGKPRLIELVRLTALGLRRHIKIRGAANPYDAAQTDYFRMRRQLGTSRPA